MEFSKIFQLIEKVFSSQAVPTVPDNHNRFTLELADYFAHALRELPDYVNLSKISKLGIVVHYIDQCHARVEIPKNTNLSDNENDRNISFRWIPMLNDIFVNIRIATENDIESTRYEVLSKLTQLQTECNYSGNWELWETKSSELVNTYWCYVSKRSHLLCGVKIVDYVEENGKLIFDVYIDSTCRISTAL